MNTNIYGRLQFDCASAVGHEDISKKIKMKQANVPSTQYGDLSLCLNMCKIYKYF